MSRNCLFPSSVHGGAIFSPREVENTFQSQRSRFTNTHLSSSVLRLRFEAYRLNILYKKKRKENRLSVVGEVA